MEFIRNYVDFILNSRIFHDLGPGPTTTLLKFKTRINFAVGLLILVNLVKIRLGLIFVLVPNVMPTAELYPKAYKVI